MKSTRVPHHSASALPAVTEYRRQAGIVERKSERGGRWTRWYRYRYVAGCHGFIRGFILHYQQLEETGAEEGEEWIRVKRRNRRKNTIVGNREDSVMKGVPSYTQLHVYRLSRDTTMQSLTEFLKVTFPEVICEAMSSKHPDLYSSFKVQIYNKKAMDPKVWPSGACVNRFLEIRKKRTTSN
nr:unnamed protein product [Callosobruchus analis]